MLFKSFILKFEFEFSLSKKEKFYFSIVLINLLTSRELKRKNVFLLLFTKSISFLYSKVAGTWCSSQGSIVLSQL